MGVNKGTVTRTSATEVTIVLSGNRTVDYDSNITNLQVTVANSQINGYTGPALSNNSGVTFTASNPVMTILSPTNQASRTYPLSGGKIIAFKASSTVDSTISFDVKRVGLLEPNFGNAEVYIDLNDNGNADSNEKVTDYGAEGTISNGAPLGISYTEQGTAWAKISISGLNLITTQMLHDIIVVGDMDCAAQIGLGGSYGFTSSKLGDMTEIINVSGNVIN